MSSHWDLVCLVYGIFACLVFSSIVCLVCGFRYWFLAASRLVARFARVRALRARCGPFGPAEVGLRCKKQYRLLKRSYLMFPRTLNVPPHSGEKYRIIARMISHVAAQMKLYMLIACLFSKSHQKPCAQKSWRRRSHRQLFYMHRL